jgi:putative PEP-CTERM system histidine kinase
MSTGNLAITAWSFGLVSLVYAFFGVYLLRLGYIRSRSGPEAAVFAAISLTALWGVCGLLYLFTASQWLLLANKLADVLRYACWFAFLLMLFRPQQGEALPASVQRLKPLAVLIVCFGVGAQILAFATRSSELASRLALFGEMAPPVFALVLLEQVYRNVADDARWNAKPLSLGLAAAFLFDLYLFSEAVLFSRLDSDALSIRGGVHSLVAPLLALSMARRRDWVSKLRMSRKAAFHSATLLMAGLYLLFIAAIGYYVRYFGGEWGRALQLGLVFGGLVGLVILALSGSVRARLRVFVGKHFFRYRYDYREEWLRFTQTLSSQHSPEAMGQQAIRGLADMLESPGGGLWLRGSGASAFSQVSRWNVPAVQEKEDQDSPFSKFLARSGWVVNLEEYRSFPRRYGEMALPVWLQDIPQAWLIVPLMVGDDLIGFVVLVSARTYMDVNWEVNDLLKTAGRQAASFLAQMQATEALLEVRKFDAFNRMSAFVVHDLKNIVTQLSLMMKNAKRLHDNPEFQQDMLMTVENSLDRMRQLMLQLREGATPVGTAYGVDLSGIAERIETVARGRGRKLELILVDRVETRGHAERLERIIGHVVQNAFDATDPSGRVWLALDRLSGQARIQVGDTGRGMSEQFVRERLFKPFQTTKEAGMGIGAYESFQYVQELGGKISVDSELNKGTLVTILLPLFENQKESDLQMLEAS